MSDIKITVKCSGCGETKVLTQKELEKAQEDKVIMCDKCFVPMFVSEVKKELSDERSNI